MSSLKAGNRKPKRNATRGRAGRSFDRITALAAALMICVAPAMSRAEAWRVSPYARVIWIGVDGVGTFFQKAETPNFDRIFAGGKITWDCVAPEPTISAPGWCSMFYGVPSGVHGITNQIAESRPFQNASLMSVFRQEMDARPGEAVGVFTTWYAIGYGMLDRKPEDTALTVFPAGQQSAEPEQTLEAALSWIQEREDFRLLFFYLDHTDIAGHAYGYGAPGYIAAITRADEMIGTLYDALAEKGLLEDALILLSTDHGGTPEGTHGEGTLAETRCVFAAAGAGLEPDTAIGPMELKDIAAIVRYALGLEQPAFSDAKVPEGLFAE